MISIIVPVYNVRPFLEKSVGSICQQSYRNLEIIVVDDGSTDGSSELCDEIAARDPRIQVIHQANAGVSMARNAGVSAAVGDFIGFVDPDDWVDSDMYETLVRLWQKHQADICVCG
ncbi:MAG: glycosyltransferase, partial [Mediterranea sp.]|nr:glycosyltransferase [Mediterranea sp.]